MNPFWMWPTVEVLNETLLSTFDINYFDELTFAIYRAVTYWTSWRSSRRTSRADIPSRPPDGPPERRTRRRQQQRAGEVSMCRAGRWRVPHGARGPLGQQMADSISHVGTTLPAIVQIWSAVAFGRPRCSANLGSTHPFRSMRRRWWWLY